MSKRYHVVPSSDGRWAIKGAETRRATAVFDRKSDAVTRARSIVRDSGGEVVVHSKDGRIREATTVPKGFGSQRGKFAIRDNIDLTKPIYEQAIRGKKK